MKPALFLRLFVFVLGFAAVGAVVRAEDLSAVKARMEQRQNSVDALKERKIVGENNRGFLEARGSLTPSDEKVMSDENADRRTVYAAIAAHSGSDADAVGRLRAQKIAASSKRGVWVQGADGQWSEKS